MMNCESSYQDFLFQQRCEPVQYASTRPSLQTDTINKFFLESYRELSEEPFYDPGNFDLPRKSREKLLKDGSFPETNADWLGNEWSPRNTSNDIIHLSNEPYFWEASSRGDRLIRSENNSRESMMTQDEKLYFRHLALESTSLKMNMRNSWSPVSGEEASPNSCGSYWDAQGRPGQSWSISPHHSDWFVMLTQEIRKFSVAFLTELDQINLKSKAKKKVWKVLDQSVEGFVHSVCHHQERCQELITDRVIQYQVEINDLEKSCLIFQENVEDMQCEIQNLNGQLKLNLEKLFALTRELRETRAELRVASDQLRQGGAPAVEANVSQAVGELIDVQEENRQLKKELGSIKQTLQGQVGELRQLNKELKTQTEALFHQVQRGTVDALAEKRQFDGVVRQLRVDNEKHIVECQEQKRNNEKEREGWLKKLQILAEELRKSKLEKLSLMESLLFAEEQLKLTRQIKMDAPRSDARNQQNSESKNGCEKTEIINLLQGQLKQQQQVIDDLKNSYEVAVCRAEHVQQCLKAVEGRCGEIVKELQLNLDGTKALNIVLKKQNNLLDTKCKRLSEVIVNRRIELNQNPVLREMSFQQSSPDEGEWNQNNLPANCELVRPEQQPVVSKNHVCSGKGGDSMDRQSTIGDDAKTNTNMKHSIYWQYKRRQLQAQKLRDQQCLLKSGMSNDTENQPKQLQKLVFNKLQLSGIRPALPSNRVEDYSPQTPEKNVGQDKRLKTDDDGHWILQQNGDNDEGASVIKSNEDKDDLDSLMQSNEDWEDQLASPLRLSYRVERSRSNPVQDAGNGCWLVTNSKTAVEKTTATLKPIVPDLVQTPVAARSTTLVMSRPEFGGKRATIRRSKDCFSSTLGGPHDVAPQSSASNIQQKLASLQYQTRIADKVFRKVILQDVLRYETLHQRPTESDTGRSSSAKDSAGRSTEFGSITMNHKILYPDVSDEHNQNEPFAKISKTHPFTAIAPSSNGWTKTASQSDGSVKEPSDVGSDPSILDVSALLGSDLQVVNVQGAAEKEQQMKNNRGGQEESESYGNPRGYDNISYNENKPSMEHRNNTQCLEDGRHDGDEQKMKADYGFQKTSNFSQNKYSISEKSSLKSADLNENVGLQQSKSRCFRNQPVSTTLNGASSSQDRPCIPSSSRVTESRVQLKSSSRLCLQYQNSTTRPHTRCPQQQYNKLPADMPQKPDSKMRLKKTLNNGPLKKASSANRAAVTDAAAVARKNLSQSKRIWK